jgi:hypothetical protein
MPHNSSSKPHEIMPMRWGDKVIELEMGGLSLHHFIVSGIFDIWDVAFHSWAITCT